MMLIRLNIHNTFCLVVALLIVTLLCTSCSTPEDEQVSQDFVTILHREAGKDVDPIVVSIYSGEGDSENVYKYVIFKIKALKDLDIKTGWVAGTNLKKGQELIDGKAELLYQKEGSSKWKLARYILVKKPTQKS